MSKRQRAVEAPDTAGSSEQLARRIAELAEDKLARDLTVLDMRDVVSYTDFLVIAPATPTGRRRPSPTACARG